MMGPLQGLKIIEISGMGPGPFAGMLFADMGAEVIRVERPGGGIANAHPEVDILNRNKRCIAVNLKESQGVELVLKMVEEADAIFEANRPGVAEKLGFGPDVCLARNQRLVYGRMTGWGQDGPLANSAGHDINYIALTGALHAIGERGGKPIPPLSLLGDFGGGGLFLAWGMACALLEAKSSGNGQVVDAAMVDGAATLMSTFYGAVQLGFWKEERGTNMFDGGSHFYDTYETADRKWVAIGPVEGRFYSLLLELLGLDPDEYPQMDMDRWPELKEKLAALFKTRTRDEWCELLEGTDSCFAPVLSMEEARHHPHNRDRGLYTENLGIWQQRPSPRFSRTDGEITRPPVAAGKHTDEILREMGVSPDEIRQLKEQGVVNQV